MDILRSLPYLNGIQTCIWRKQGNTGLMPQQHQAANQLIVKHLVSHAAAESSNKNRHEILLYSFSWG